MGEGDGMVRAVWREKMRFAAEARSHSAEMDAKSPLGSDSAMTPKELLLSAICGCTGMDVVALLRKHRQPFTSFRLVADATTVEGKHPAVFAEVRLAYQIHGEVDPARALEAVRLSLTKYCSVSAMVSRAVPISYTVVLNEAEVGSGVAKFE